MNILGIIIFIAISIFLVYQIITTIKSICKMIKMRREKKKNLKTEHKEDNANS